MLDVGFQFAVVIAQIDGRTTVNPVLRESGRTVVVVPFDLAAFSCSLGTLAHVDRLVVFAVHTAHLQRSFERDRTCGIAVQRHFDGSRVAGGSSRSGADTGTGDGDSGCTVVIGATEHIPAARVEQFAQTGFSVDRPGEGATAFHLHLIRDLCAVEASCIFEFRRDSSRTAVAGRDLTGRGIYSRYIGIGRRVGDRLVDRMGVIRSLGGESGVLSGH